MRNASGSVAMPVTVAPGGLGEQAWAVITGIPAGMKFSVDGVAAAISGGTLSLASVAGPTTYDVRVTEFPAEWNGSVALT